MAAGESLSDLRNVRDGVGVSFDDAASSAYTGQNARIILYKHPNFKKRIMKNGNRYNPRNFANFS